MAVLTLPFNAPGQASSGPLFHITNTGTGAALAGTSDATSGSTQLFPPGPGVAGYGAAGTGVCGQSDSGNGVNGVSDSGVGVAALSISNIGLSAFSSSGQGINSYSSSGQGINSYSAQAEAGYFQTDGDSDALVATTSSPNNAAVTAINTYQASGQVPSGFGLRVSSSNTGIYASGTPAAFIDGDHMVTGDLILTNAVGGDVAEDFDVEDDQVNLQPGTVLIINKEGKLCASTRPYDTRVAGVVAGAGDLHPAVVLQRVPSQKPRSPIALVGKAFCKVDAAFGEVKAGDLLTTSHTPGYAMKASKRSRALGAIIGKALAGLDAGMGLIPILVSPR
jgi:hypothetical protein